MVSSRRLCVLGVGVVLLAACGGGVAGSSLEEQAVGRWECEVRFSEDITPVTVDVDAGGTYTLTGRTGQEIHGTWERSGDEVRIDSDAPIVPGLTYQGATDDPDELTVVEADGVTGVFDVDIDGDEVVFTQTEYGGGEAADPEFPVVYACTKQ